jgi:hypothetical protein
VNRALSDPKISDVNPTPEQIVEGLKIFHSLGMHPGDWTSYKLRNRLLALKEFLNSLKKD